jgi:hypothetical protein
VDYWKDWRPVKQPNLSIELGRTVKALTGKEDVIATDMAWEISWYADRKTVWLPYDPETMKKISRSVPIDYVFVTLNMLQPVAAYKDDIWQKLYLGADPVALPGYTRVTFIYYGNTLVGVLFKAEKDKKHS